MKKISVITPIFNTKKFLSKLINCLKSQTYKNLELIFVDDGSTDGGINLIEEEFAGYKNVKIFKNETNIGTFLTRYKAFKNCTGDYFICIDSDDYIDDNYLETLLNFAIANNCDFAMTNIIKVANNIECKNNYFFTEKFWEGKQSFVTALNNTEPNIPFLLSGKLIKTEILKLAIKDIEKYVETIGHMTMGEDIIYSLMFLYYSKKAGITTEPKYYYIYHDNQTITMDTKTRLLSKFDGLFRGIQIVKNILTQKRQYGKYKDNFYKFAKCWQACYFVGLCEHNCIEESEEIIQKYLKF